MAYLQRVCFFFPPFPPPGSDIRGADVRAPVGDVVLFSPSSPDVYTFGFFAGTFVVVGGAGPFLPFFPFLTSFVFFFFLTCHFPRVGVVTPLSHLPRFCSPPFGWGAATIPRAVSPFFFVAKVGLPVLV